MYIPCPGRAQKMPVGYEATAEIHRFSLYLIVERGRKRINLNGTGFESCASVQTEAGIYAFPMRGC
jgi:hypothetical protein